MNAGDCREIVSPLQLPRRWESLFAKHNNAPSTLSAR
jgi:hypothetical protein